MELTLPKLEIWQYDVAKCLQNIKGSGKIFSVLSSRQCGKSILIAEALIYFAGNNKNTVSIIIEPTFPQCSNIFQQMLKWIQETPIVQNINKQEMSITFINGSKILCKSCAQRDGLRGFTCDFLAVDEACFVGEDVYPLILPWTNAKNAPILLVSTPLFCEGTFYNFWSNPDNIMSFSFDWSTYDKSKYLTKDKLEYFRKTLPKSQFEAEFLGKWITDGAYAFSNISRCTNRLISNKKPVAVGIDWGAGNGQDYTWCTFIDEDGCVAKLLYFNDIDSVQQINIIAEAINSEPSLKCVQVEKNSIGKVFGDNLKSKLKRPAIMKFFVTDNTSKKEIIEDLITAFSNELISIPDDAELNKQLLHYAVEKTKTTYTYNAIKGYHDDACISLALAWNAIHKKSSYSIAISRNKYK